MPLNQRIGQMTPAQRIALAQKQAEAQRFARERAATSAVDNADATAGIPACDNVLPEGDSAVSNSPSLKAFKESMSYKNDLTKEQIEEFVQREATRVRERLSKDYLSAATLSKLLGLTHSRIASRFEKGTPVSVIIANTPAGKPVNLDSIVSRLTEEQKEELIRRLQNAE